MKYFVAVAACFACYASAGAQIAFTKNHQLYVLDCDTAGLPTKNSHPKKICRIEESPILSWLRNGKINLYWDSQNQAAVAPIPGTKPTMGSGDYLVDSPNKNSKLIGKTPDPKTYFEDVYLQSDNDKRLLANGVEDQPLWSPQGDVIALTYHVKNGDDQCSELISYPQVEKRIEIALNTNSRFGDFSPDGKWISISEGPLEYRAAQIVDVHTGKQLHRKTLSGWQTNAVINWSPDSRQLLEIYRSQDEADHWTKSCAAICDLSGLKSKPISHSSGVRDLAFARDGHHIVWIRNGRLEMFDRNHPLERTVLANQVDEFAIHS